MNAERTYSLGEVRTILGRPGKSKPASTVRDWTATFAVHLSAGANPPTGQERRYTDTDLTTLRLVARMRDEHVPLDEVANRLAASPVEPGEVIADRSVDPTESLQVATEQPGTALATIAVVHGIDERLRAMEQRQAAVEQRQASTAWHRSPALWLAIGVIAGAAIVLASVVALQFAR